MFGQSPPHQELLNHPIADHELSELLGRMGQAEFGGADITRIRDVVEALGAPPEVIAEHLAAMRGGKLAESRMLRQAGAERRLDKHEQELKKHGQELDLEQSWVIALSLLFAVFVLWTMLKATTPAPAPNPTNTRSIHRLPR